MTLLLIFIGLLLLFIFGSILLVMLAFGQARTPDGNKSAVPEKIVPFRWKAVLLPIVILLLVAVMCAWFYGKLPEEAASRFAADGTASAFVSRGTLILWALLPQLLLTLLTLMVAWGVTRVGALLRGTEEFGIRLENLLFVMGNMVVLPQLILGFAMLNTFGYNAYQVRIVPLWGIAVIVVIAGAVILGAFFISTIHKILVKDSK